MPFFTSAAQRREAQRTEDQSQYLRGEGKKQSQYYIGTMEKPQPTALTTRRIQALGESSRDVPLAEDPYFQGQRQALLGQGAKELSAVGARQKAYGVKGGFSNIGSQQDIQDRLGVALAELQGRAQQGRLDRLGQAADLDQRMQDMQVEFANAQRQALAALEAGDVQAGLQALQQASALRQGILQQQQAFIGGLVQTAGSAISPRGGK